MAEKPEIITTVGDVLQRRIVDFAPSGHDGGGAEHVLLLGSGQAFQYVAA